MGQPEKVYATPDMLETQLKMDRHISDITHQQHMGASTKLKTLRLCSNERTKSWSTEKNTTKSNRNTSKEHDTERL